MTDPWFMYGELVELIILQGRYSKIVREYHTDNQNGIKRQRHVDHQNQYNRQMSMA